MRIASFRTLAASDFDDEIERSLSGAFAGHAHLQVRAVETIAAVAGLVPEVELRGENTLAGRLYLDVDVTRAPGVFPRNDGLQAIAPLSVGELVAAIAKAAVVVLAAFVRVPEIEQGVRDWLASRRQDLAGHDQPRGLGLRFHERNAEWSIRLEKRPFGLRRRECTAGERTRLSKGPNHRKRGRDGEEPAAGQRGHGFILSCAVAEPWIRDPKRPESNSLPIGK